MRWWHQGTTARNICSRMYLTFSAPTICSSHDDTSSKSMNCHSDLVLYRCKFFFPLLFWFVENLIFGRLSQYFLAHCTALSLSSSLLLETSAWKRRLHSQFSSFSSQFCFTFFFPFAQSLSRTLHSFLAPHFYSFFSFFHFVHNVTEQMVVVIVLCVCTYRMPLLALQWHLSTTGRRPLSVSHALISANKRKRKQNEIEKKFIGPECVGCCSRLWSHNVVPCVK